MSTKVWAVPPAEFRARAIALVRSAKQVNTTVRSGEQVNTTVYELGISPGRLHNWRKQYRIGGEISGVPSTRARAL